MNPNLSAQDRIFLHVHLDYHLKYPHRSGIIRSPNPENRDENCDVLIIGEDSTLTLDALTANPLSYRAILVFGDLETNFPVTFQADMIVLAGENIPKDISFVAKNALFIVGKEYREFAKGSLRPSPKVFPLAIPEEGLQKIVNITTKTLKISWFGFQWSYPLRITQEETSPLRWQKAILTLFNTLKPSEETL